MPRLMMLAAAPEPTTAATRFGGVPLVEANAGRRWPTCASCDGAMQFLGQLLLPEGLMALFMCQNDPGMCDEWDANAGGTAAFVVDPTEPLVTLDAPSEGETTLGASWGAKVLEVEVSPEDIEEYGSAYDVAREAQPSGRQVLGVLGGEPPWIQGDETPVCDGCDERMQPVALLEEGPDHTTAMNFGGGCAYVFRCDCGSAKLLWQQ